ncbi:MAG TPA: MEDS domain-containing protein [Vicinamibacterales bacterium]|nr:MEDS domain-containing protein [Vicinamibacterales bacterium]
MLLNPGDHVCAIYSTRGELAEAVGEFLAEGLRKSERCWYVPAADEPPAIRAELEERGVNTTRAIDRGALNILSSQTAYTVRGDFDPEETLAVFSSAIEQALSDGFSGFRAAANMSWALDLENGVERLVTYEALLRSLFASAPATGLCLYDRTRMPLAVVDGALSTHPVVRSDGMYRMNPFYDSCVHSFQEADPIAVTSKLAQLGLSGLDRREGRQTRPKHAGRRK